MKADAVVALIIDDGVLLAFCREKVGIVAFATFKHIVACFAVEDVIACFAEKKVVAFAAIWVFNDCIVTEGYIINVIFRRSYRYLFKDGRL